MVELHRSNCSQLLITDRPTDLIFRLPESPSKLWNSSYFHSPDVVREDKFFLKASKSHLSSMKTYNLSEEVRVCRGFAKYRIIFVF